MRDQLDRDLGRPISHVLPLERASPEARATKDEPSMPVDTQSQAASASSALPVSPPPHLDALVRAPEVNFSDGRLLDELGADVGILPSRCGERPAAHSPFPARVSE